MSTAAGPRPVARDQLAGVLARAVAARAGERAALDAQRQPPRFTTPLLQRKVGFEFQTGWQVGWTGLPIAMTALTKDTALIQGEGWKLTRDDGDAEFVTEAIEEGDYARLTKVFIDLRRITEELARRSDEPVIPTSDLPGVTNLGGWTNIVPAEKQMPANPQMTAGIDMAKLTAVMAALGETHRPETAAVVGGREHLMGALSQVRTGGSPEYDGLVALMASYANLSTGMLAYADTAKNITTLMSRTNLAVAYALTPEGRATTSVLTKANVLLGDVVAAAGMHVPAVTYTALWPGMRLVPPSVIHVMKTLPQGGDPVAYAESIRTGPTIREWVNGIVNGKDLLTGINTVGTVSMGSMGTEPVSNIKRAGAYSGTLVNEGIIVEFRDLKKKIPQRTWADWAGALLKWITAVNDPATRGASIPAIGTREAATFDMTLALESLMTATAPNAPVGLGPDAGLFEL